jgi:hypothetical protein
MRIRFQLLLIVLAAGLGLALGFALRANQGRSAAEVTAPPADAGAKRPGASKFHRRPPVSDDSPLATQLERNLTSSSGVTRWLYWLGALEKATPRDFPRLARLAKGNPTMLGLVATRWVEVAPHHLFDTLVAASKGLETLPVQELARVLVSEWPKRDPEAAIAAFNEPAAMGMWHAWRLELAAAILDTDVERGLHLMAEWHIENNAVGLSAAAKWAAADPRHAAEFTPANSTGYMAQETMKVIGKEWAKTDPAAALAFAATRPGGLSAALVTTVLVEWAARDPDEAAQWLAGADGQTGNRLTPAFVKGWAETDTASALAWCADNLTGSNLVAAVEGAIAGAAEKDVAGAAALVTAMEPSPARAAAAVAVARQWYGGDRPLQPEAVAWIVGLDPVSAGPVASGLLERAIPGSDPKTIAAAFLAAANSGRIPDVYYLNVAGALVAQDPPAALDWASQLPGGLGLAAGREAFRQWGEAQPQAAMQWFNALPSADARREPFFRVAAQLQPRMEDGR